MQHTQQSLQANDPFREALKDYQAGNFEKARQGFEKLSRIYPTSSEVWLNLGNAHYQMDEYDDARRDWKKAIELDPLEDKAYLNLGNLNFKQGCYRAAIFYWELFKILRAKNANVLLNLALAYERMADMKNALVNYKAYIELNPTHPDSVKIKTRFSKAKELYDQFIRQAQKALVTDLKTARKQFEQAFQHYPGEVEDLKTFAAMLYKMNELNLAKTYYLCALKDAPKDSAILINLGVIAEKLQDPVMALWAFKAASQVPGASQGQVAQRFQTLLFQKKSELDQYFQDAELLLKRGDNDLLDERLDIIRTLAPFATRGETIAASIETTLREAKDPRFLALKKYPLMADDAVKNGKYDQALMYYNKMLELEPSGPYADEIQKRAKAVKEAIGQVISTVMTLKD